MELKPFATHVTAPEVPPGPEVGLELAGLDRSDSRLLWSVFESIWAHKAATVFQDPVTDEVAPGYSQVIKTPMCLSVIRSKLHDGEIANATNLYLALNLMITNALIFNQPGSEVYKLAQTMLDVCKRECEPLLAVETITKIRKRDLGDDHEDDGHHQ